MNPITYVRVTESIWLNPQTVESVVQLYAGADIQVTTVSGKIYNFTDIGDMQKIIDSLTGKLATS